MGPESAVPGGERQGDETRGAARDGLGLFRCRGASHCHADGEQGK